MKTGADNAVVGGNDQAFIVKPDIRIESVKSFTTEQENKIVLAAGADLIPMIEESSIIIQGKVESSRVSTGLNAYGDTMIYTYHLIKVSDHLKGKLDNPNYLEFRVIGGKIGALELTVSHTPVFNVEKPFVLFSKYYGNTLGLTYHEIGKIDLQQ